MLRANTTPQSPLVAALAITPREETAGKSGNAAGKAGNAAVASSPVGNAKWDIPGNSRTCPAALRLAQEGVQGQPRRQGAPKNVRGREAEGGTRQGKHLQGEKKGNILVIPSFS